jgi:mRNA interferase RelE/StbE
MGAERLKEDKTTWRLRVGDYRILYHIDDKNAQILITRVAHRKEAYPKKGTLAARAKGKR